MSKNNTKQIVDFLNNCIYHYGILSLDEAINIKKQLKLSFSIQSLELYCDLFDNDTNNDFFYIFSGIHFDYKIDYNSKYGYVIYDKEIDKNNYMFLLDNKDYYVYSKEEFKKYDLNDEFDDLFCDIFDQAFENISDDTINDFLKSKFELEHFDNNKNYVAKMLYINFENHSNLIKKALSDEEINNILNDILVGYKDHKIIYEAVKYILDFIYKMVRRYKYRGFNELEIDDINGFNNLFKDRVDILSYFDNQEKYFYYSTIIDDDLYNSYIEDAPEADKKMFEEMLTRISNKQKEDFLNNTNKK